MGVGAEFDATVLAELCEWIDAINGFVPKEFEVEVDVYVCWTKRGCNDASVEFVVIYVEK